MPLVFTLKSPPSIPVEVENLHPARLATLAMNECRQLNVQCGNEQRPCEDFFDITGSAQDDLELQFIGDGSQFKNIGQKLQQGTIRVIGNAGLHLGAEMQGGEIIVTGNVADWAGTEMKGGRIYIDGNAGDFLGATYRGGRKGMTGGEILVTGNAGDEIGRAMRRGLIAIGGQSGSATGYHMLAGTILLFGPTGKRLGAGMKRGTIACLNPQQPENLLPTFLPAAQYRPPFMYQYLQHLRSLKFPVPDDLLTAEYIRFCGDFAETGRGEILICAG